MQLVSRDQKRMRFGQHRQTDLLCSARFLRSSFSIWGFFSDQSEPTSFSQRPKCQRFLLLLFLMVKISQNGIASVEAWDIRPNLTYINSLGSFYPGLFSTTSFLLEFQANHGVCSCYFDCQSHDLDDMAGSY